MNTDCKEISCLLITSNAALLSRVLLATNKKIDLFLVLLLQLERVGIYLELYLQNEWPVFMQWSNKKENPCVLALSCVLHLRFIRSQTTELCVCIYQFCSTKQLIFKNWIQMKE